MSDFDEVLQRIQNQLDKMKKSLRGGNRDFARVTTGADPRKRDGATRKKLPPEPPQKPPKR
jgi:hypothetical protein